MSAYVLIPLSACVVCSAFTLTLWMRHSRSRPNRVGGLMIALTAFWALCEVLWNLAPDAASARFWISVAAPSWCLLGGLGFHLFAAVCDQETRYRRVLQGLYAVGAAGTLLVWTSELMIAEMVRTSWGWAYRTGSAYPVWYALTTAAGFGGLYVWLRHEADRDLDGDRATFRTLLFGALAPLCVGTTTDGVLPMLDVQVPRLATASFAVLVGLVIHNNLRSGDFFASPAVFAREILDTLGDGVALVSEAGRMRVVNGALERMTGSSFEELVGTPARRWLPALPTGETRLPMEIDCELVTRAGHTLPVSLRCAELRDDRERLIGSVLVVRDVRELESLRSRLAISGRLAAVGELAAGIAHEINNPIAFVRANLGMLRSHWQSLASKTDEDARRGQLGELLAEGEELIQESLEGIDRAADIVRDVRELSHVGQASRELGDVNDVLDRVIRVARTALGDGVRVERESRALPLVECSPPQLGQVFLNLLVNAGQAMGGAGVVRVSTGFENERVVVSVEDEGPGVAEHERSRIFDPFFTTKPVGEGTGLGLSISYEIVRRHGGEIDVEPREPGRGACFRVWLPVRQEEGDR